MTFGNCYVISYFHDEDDKKINSNFVLLKM